jgi:predicted acylesterase/phospholipase RssA
MTETPGVPGLRLFLSGGGFRATFFHLGVFKLLRDFDLVHLIKSIHGVSGGSILAGHLAANWTSYAAVGDEAAFYRKAAELVKFGQMDFRGRMVRRYLALGWCCGRRFQLEQQLIAGYSQLFDNKVLREMPEDPKFEFLTTSLTTGRLCRFTRDGFDDGKFRHPAADISIGLSVAASSAFPPLFPPVELSLSQLGATSEHFPQNKERLSDGGVWDNVGVSAIIDAQGRGIGKENEILVISDASLGLTWQLDHSFRGPVTRNVRATDIIMTRVAELERARATNARSWWISISENVEPKELATDLYTPLELDVQRPLASVRTDLDRFTLEEITSLIRHGYEAAAHVLIKKMYQTECPPLRDPCTHDAPDTFFPFEKFDEIQAQVELKTRMIKAVKPLRKFQPTIPSIERELYNKETAEKWNNLAKLLRSSRLRRNLLLGLVDFHDWASWLILVILLAIIIACLLATLITGKFLTY